MQEMTLLQAIKNHLLLPGENIKLEEYKKLTDQDKIDLAIEFEKVGVKIIT